MKINLTLIGILLLVLLLASILYMGKLIIKQNAHIDNLQQNQEQYFGDSLNKKLELNKAEFRHLLAPVLDSIEAIKNVKSKHITNVTKIYNSYHDSTIIINQAAQLSDTTYDISIRSPCWGFNGYFNIVNKSATITDRWARDDITKFTYFKRNRLFKWKWTPHWGSKRYYIESYSKCKSKVKVEEFEVIKR